MEISVLLRRTTADKISTEDWTSLSDGTELTVVVAELEEPVMVSEAVKVPDGTVIVMEVERGFVMTEAVTALVPPVIVSPIVKLLLSATVSVIVPSGYSVIPEATVWVTSATVQRFNPLLAQSANKRFNDLRAVLAS